MNFGFDFKNMVTNLILVAKIKLEKNHYKRQKNFSLASAHDKVIRK